MLGLIKLYEKKTGNRVETEAIPYEEALNQLILRSRGGNITGAAQAAVEWMSTLGSLGVLKDLSSAAEGAGYTEAALNAGQFEGTQYGLPWTTASIGIVANKELLDRAGVPELPKTIEEFEAAMDSLKGLGGGVIPYAAMTDPAQLKDIIPWMWTYGAEIIEDGKVFLGDEGSVRAVEWYKSLLVRGYAAPGMDRFDARALFSQGKVGFYEDAILAKGVLSEQSPDKQLADKIVPVPRPVEGSGDPQSLLWGHLVVVFEGEGSDAATDFAKFITSDTEATLQYFEAAALPPATTKAIESKEVTNDEYTSTWTNEVTKYARPNPFWSYKEFARLDSILGEQVQAALLGKAGPKEALETAREKISSIIA